jgi:hypothetical protein
MRGLADVNVHQILVPTSQNVSEFFTMTKYVIWSASIITNAYAKQKKWHDICMFQTGAYSKSPLWRCLMKHILIAAAAFAITGTANAATTVIDFDSIITGDNVGTTYAGFDFVNWQTTTGFGEPSEPNFAFNTDGASSVDVTAGFTSLSFTFGEFNPATIGVFSGLGGTGILLGSAVFDSGDPGIVTPGTVAFSGIAHSIVVLDEAGSFGWDDVTFGSAVPEPAGWALMLAGFGMIGGAMRRRAIIAA